MHYLRLFRVANLLIVFATMYSLGLYFDEVYPFGELAYGVGSLTFFLFTFSMALITAGGYIINDYYDVECDKINKPRTVVVERHISRKTALNLYRIVTGLGIGLILFVGIQTGFWLFILVYITAAFLLWLYSYKLKKMSLVGNFVVAALTAWVPLVVGYFFLLQWIVQDGMAGEGVYPLNIVNHSLYPRDVAALFALFAFMLNFIREIVKDMEDVDGDLFVGARTFAIQYGENKTKTLVIALLSLVLLLAIPILFYVDTNKIDAISLLPLGLSFLHLMVTFGVMTRVMNKKRLKFAGLQLKLAMVFGLLLPLFWVLIK